MSTKIHDGCRLRISSLKGLRDFALRAGDEIRKVQMSLWDQKVVDLATFLIDRAALGLPIEKGAQGRCPLLAAPRLAKKESWADEDRKSDLDFTICLFPRERDVLAIFFSGSQELREAWNALPGVEPWGYWNNTDRPADVSKAEWTARMKAWAKALRFDDKAGDGVPRNSALSVEGSLDARLLFGDVYVRLQPSYEKRVETHVFNAMWAKWIEGREIDSGNVFRLFREHAEWKRDKPDEAAAMRAPIETEVRAKLKPVLEAADFSTDLPKDEKPDTPD